jgi:hypothetical protein
MSASQSPRGREDSPRPPKYSRSKEKDRHDRAYLWLNGKRVWLGRYGSPESKAKYAEMIGGAADTKIIPRQCTRPPRSELTSATEVPPQPFTIGDVGRVLSHPPTVSVGSRTHFAFNLCVRSETMI